MEIGIHFLVIEEQKLLLVQALEMRLQRCRDNAWTEEAKQLQALLTKVEAAWAEANTPEHPYQIRCICSVWVSLRWNDDRLSYWYECDHCGHIEYIPATSEQIAYQTEQKRRDEIEALELFKHIGE
jgi:hypothetical protein